MFSGIMLEDMVAKKINDLINSLRDTGAEVKWVEMRNLHITVMFYGEVDGNEIINIKKRLAQTASSNGRFEVEFTGIGGFPSINNPRVIWVDIKGGEKLRNIIEMVNNGKRQHEEIVLHLTIGRSKGSRNKRELVNLLKKEVDRGFGKMIIGSIQLIKSKLTSKGAIYEVIENYQLNKN
ncbi:MAG: RNA 2',3'-cyclic phosphodiesterase [bacterium]